VYRMENEMKKRVGYLIVIVLLALVCVAGCNQRANDIVDNVVNTAAQMISGDVTGTVGKVYATEWFEFTIHSIDQVDSYAGYEPGEGYILYDVVISEKNIFESSIPMGTFDFYMDDSSFIEYIWAIDPLDDTMMPLEFELMPEESVLYHMIYEIPDDVTDLVLAYTEIDEEDNEGRTFTINIQ